MAPQSGFWIFEGIPFPWGEQITPINIELGNLDTEKMKRNTKSKVCVWEITCYEVFQSIALLFSFFVVKRKDGK
jgi:hypothetical protein